MFKPSGISLAQRYDLALLDLDGVVYAGKHPIIYASESIQAAERAGMSITYTTNNSSRYRHEVAAQLAGFQLQVRPEQVITSSVVAARLIADYAQPGAKVLVVGADHLRDEVRSAGFVVVDSVEDRPDVVIQGWKPTLTWQEIAEGCFAVEQGATYVVTNRDLTIPREHGIAPGCGSLIQAAMCATGVEPVASAGKPECAMYDQARLLALQSTGRQYDTALCLAIGDRLDTDIEAANRGGYDSLLVLTGVCDAQQLMRAPAGLRPTYVAQDLRGLLVEHPAVHAGQDCYACGEARAWLEGDEVAVNADSLDALRCATRLAWDYADEHHEMPALHRIERNAWLDSSTEQVLFDEEY